MARALVRAALVGLGVCTALTTVARADVEIPRPDPNATISFGADQANTWLQGVYEVWLLKGNCRVTQGETTAKSDEAVLWIKRAGEFGDRQNLVITYLEGNVQINYLRAGFPYTIDDKSWLGEFFSSVPIQQRTPAPGPEPSVKPPVFERAQARRDPLSNRTVRRTQFSQFDSLPPPVVAAPVGKRRLRAFPRSAVKVQAQWFPDPTGKEWIAVISSGVNLIIDGIDGYGSLDIATDRMVLWTRNDGQPDLTGQALQGNDQPLEIYMEGNIVFRQGERTIYATRMYYDVTNEVGTILQADVFTPVPNYRGLLRLRADLVQQTGRDRFFAQRGTLTSSRLENPGFRLQASELAFEDLQQPVVNTFTGEPLVDPVTGQQVVAHQQLATSRNNFVFVGPVPVFYWPTLKTDLTQPTYYLRRNQFKQDKIFGTQVYVDLDTFQLLGRQKPAGTDWTVTGDYLSLRGFAGGTHFTYNRDAVLGVPGPATGFIDLWGLRDHGLDILGNGRYKLVPEQTNRYRVFGRHRQYLADGWRVSAELGRVSDNNFLEQYYEYEWDTLKDQATGVELKRLVDNQSYALSSDVRLNQFFTETEQLPRLDHFWMGQSLLGDRLTWFEHSSAEYARLRIYSYPNNPTDASQTKPLPWELTTQGERFVSRQEIDLPFNAGAGKIVPYALGELGHWGQDLNGNDLNRLYGQAGIRASVPFWSVNPLVENSLFNVHGLAHKIVLDADLSYADANRNYLDLPLYDNVDDNSQEHFRSRFQVLEYGGNIPLKFQERSYALRSGLGSWVSSPSAEIADNLAALRLGARQRWQTKRGPIENRRIIDWITLDTEAVLFPDPNRDNFGQAVGLADYDLRWHVGDRLTLLSSGVFDFFSQGQRIYTVAMTLNRPPRGSLYGGFTSISGGPVDNHVLNAYYTYRLSPKWISTGGVAVDVTGLGLIGNQFSLTRVGESFLTSFNFIVDKYKHNVGVNFTIEPRFLPRNRLGNVGGAQIPLAGAFGLE